MPFYIFYVDRLEFHQIRSTDGRKDLDQLEIEVRRDLPVIQDELWINRRHRENEAQRSWKYNLGFVSKGLKIAGPLLAPPVYVKPISQLEASQAASNSSLSRLVEVVFLRITILNVDFLESIKKPMLQIGLGYNGQRCTADEAEALVSQEVENAFMKVTNVAANAFFEARPRIAAEIQSNLTEMLQHSASQLMAGLAGTVVAGATTAGVGALVTVGISVAGAALDAIFGDHSPQRPNEDGEVVTATKIVSGPDLPLLAAHYRQNGSGKMITEGSPGGHAQTFIHVGLSGPEHSLLWLADNHGLDGIPVRSDPAGQSPAPPARLALKQGLRNMLKECRSRSVCEAFGLLSP